MGEGKEIQSIQKKESAMKLEIELVPQTLFEQNLRSLLTKKQWDKVRRTAYAEYGNQCAICGGHGNKHPVEAHELWVYDDVIRTQTLQEVVAVCPLCHKALHIGRSMSVLNTSELVKLEAHMAKLLPHKDLLAVVKHALQVWNMRNQFVWQQKIPDEVKIGTQMFNLNG